MKDRLTAEQSARLIELGVDPSKASDNTEIGAWADSEYGKPIYTLSNLLSLLPKEIKADGITYHLNIDYPPILQVAARYITEYSEEECLKGMMCDNLIDCLYELLIWCVKEKFVKL